MANPRTIRCEHCATVLVHDKRNVSGCNCDPDAPQWVCIQPDGKVFGLSNAKWEELE